ncbi:hypothetical protein RRG08_028833 [Elysia crispata]|uniref:Uncharacterized protein n=1 Tax=Elysia crispata TaxID=231223 RepID=A0AAE0Z047_9GAST|nr:hypothetical protein RRG08_028833 [Elysia crispata]
MLSITSLERQDSIGKTINPHLKVTHPKVQASNARELTTLLRPVDKRTAIRVVCKRTPWRESLCQAIPCRVTSPASRREASSSCVGTP